MDEVVAAYGESVAVARNLPDGQVGTRGLHSGGYRCGTPVDGVHAVGVHVVGQTRGASDAGDDHGLFWRNLEFGHCLVEHVEDGVVAASGAPAHALLVLVVGRCVLVLIVFHCVFLLISALCV